MGIAALAFACVLAMRVVKSPVGTDRMKEISDAIHEGAMAFLFREYRALAMFVIVMFAVINIFINWQTAVSYITGTVASVLAGALVTGVMIAIQMANSGGVWDNAKKYIESGNYGGKGTPTHAAAVVGNTVGDPFKDTSGPSLNILIKLMTIVALVFAPLFMR